MTTQPKKSSRRTRAAMIGGAILGLCVIFVYPSFAQTINLTPIIDVVNQLPSVITPIGTVISAMIPIMLLVSIYSFITGLFDGLLVGIVGSMHKRM